MSRPVCTRIEITYADGSRNVADHNCAEAIIAYFEKLQSDWLANGGLLRPVPQLGFIPISAGKKGVLFGGPE